MNETRAMGSIVSGLKTKSDKIRTLADAGYSRTEIARYLDIRYQHVRNVLVARENGQKSRTSTRTAKKNKPKKPRLTVKILSKAGFELSGYWVVDGDGIGIKETLVQEPAVYVFVIDSQPVYIGKTSKNLKKRMYFYANPGSRQRTNQRLKPMIRENIECGKVVAIYTASPGFSEWNGLPVDLVDGLEAALIRTYDLPWNKRGI